MNAHALSPSRQPRRGADRALGDALLVEFSTAEDVAGGIAGVAALLRERADVERFEWWAPAEDGASLRVAAADGAGARTPIPIRLGAAGALRVTGSLRVTDALEHLAPVIRRRWTDERLAAHATLLARRVEALDDFAALVAHELKRALSGDDPALELVDSILDAVRSESAGGWSSPGACLAQALADLGELDADVVSSLPEAFPLPSRALRILLRNLVANAAAAGARRIRVSANLANGCWTLLVDDDGAGIEVRDRYAAGSRLGLALCTRLVQRLDGSLELRPRPRGGTRAAIAVGGER